MHKLNPNANGDRVMAALYEKSSGRMVSVYSNATSLQVNTGNSLAGVFGKGKHVYRSSQGVSLATQTPPNAVNAESCKSPWVMPGQVYEHRTTYQFSVRDS